MKLYFHRVWQRNFDVYCATWKLNFIPPLLEPLLYLFAFGYGLGGFVREVTVAGHAVPYLKFIAPGLVATAVMNHGFFETTYSSFVRMYYQKTFDAILSTPLMIEDVVLGELAWGATKALMAGTIMFAVAGVMGLLCFPQALLMPLVMVLGGVVFSSLGMCFTAWSKNIEMFNLPVFLFVTPMFLFSGIFFPLDALPSWAQSVAWFLPLTFFVSVLRELALGSVGPGFGFKIAVLAFLAVGASLVSLTAMKRRLLR